MNLKKLFLFFSSFTFLLATTGFAGQKSFATSKTDLFTWLVKAQDFEQKINPGSQKIDLSQRFDIPTTLPWKNVLPIYIRSGRGTLEYMEEIKIVTHVSFRVEGYHPVYYSNAFFGESDRLFLIERSVSPTTETLGRNAHELVETGFQFLHAGPYIIAQGLYHDVTGQYLDTGTTTLFPADRLEQLALSAGFQKGKPCEGDEVLKNEFRGTTMVVHCNDHLWDQFDTIIFGNYNAGLRSGSDNEGARLVIEVPKKKLEFTLPLPLDFSKYEY